MFAQITHLIQEGGFVMYPLLLGSFVSLYVLIERTLTLKKYEQDLDILESQLEQVSEQKELKEQTYSSKLVQSFVNSIRECWSEQDSTKLEEALQVSLYRSEPELDSGLSTLNTITTVSPLIGLLGTITGMMGVFRVVSEKLANNPQADTTSITAGIGEALIATATGILVAVISLLAHNMLQAWADKIRHRLEGCALTAIQAHRKLTQKSS